MYGFCMIGCHEEEMEGSRVKANWSPGAGQLGFVSAAVSIQLFGRSGNPWHEGIGRKHCQGQHQAGMANIRGLAVRTNSRAHG